MPPPTSPDVTVVLPTFNRAAALADNLPGLLDLEGVREVVVVDDGSTDATADALAAIRDPRLRVIRQAENRGQPAARNRGAAAARTTWVLFAEDDVRFPRDYAAVLRQEAVRHHADIVGAPWIHAGGEEPAEAIARARAHRVARPTIDEPSGVPIRPVITPFLPAPVLVRRAVFDDICFDEGLGGNAYREETEFFVAASRHGFICLLTPATASWQEKQYGGGARRSRLAYEYWVVRNNWRFLRRQGPWLASQGYISGRARAQAAFVARRLAYLVAGFVRARLTRT